METLNNKQLEAVKTTEGYLRVIAGAGSGKTKMLVSRYIYILKELGINPNNIICLTFSNKTASEMKKRIKDILKDEDLSFVTTYHGLGARIIRENTNLLFFPNSFQIIDRADQKQILTEIYEELEIKLDTGTFEKIIDKMEIFKSDLKYIGYVIDTNTSDVEYPTFDIDSEIIRKYISRQKKHFLVDFADLINYAIYLLEQHKSVRDKWQAQLNYVLVDEFQDSTSKEVRLVDLISGAYQNVMVVGDPDQNIYEWRGSEMKYLVDFDLHHQDTKTIVMSQNYRSTSKILKCANTLIAFNKNRYPKDLFTNNEAGEDVTYYQADNDFKEAEWICNKIKYLTGEQEIPYSDIAILYRASYLSRVMEGKLNENAIPYEIIGNVKFFQRMEIRDIISYMKLVSYDDDYAFKRIVNVPKRQFGKMKMNVLQSLRQNDESLYQTLKNNIDKFKGSKVKEFIEVIDYARENINQMTVLSIFEYLLDKTGYQKYIREMGNEERLDNLAELRRVIQGLLVDDSSIKLENALAYFALQSDYETENIDKIKLMTCHAAKGLEYSVVFVIGLNEGSFPSKKTIEERGMEGLEEERRLCYVALTRAKKMLFLTSPQSFASEGGGKAPSRFLDEIGEENYLSINVKKEPKKKFEEPVLKHKPLDQVTHKIFGRGIIVDIDYQFKSYKVLFDSSKLPRNVDFNYSFEEDEIIEAEVVEVNEIPLKKKSGKKEIFSEKQKALLEKKAQEVKEQKETKKEVEPVTVMFDNSLSPQIKNLDKASYGDLWNDPNLPKTGWRCVGITDLGVPCGFCAMCGQDGIRYLHHMKHDDYYRLLSVGCVCAGKMENNGEQAENREKNFKGRINRRLTFLNKDWNISRNGNMYLKYQGHNLTLFKTKEGKFIVYYDNTKLDKSFETIEEAKNAIFDCLENE